ncbi:MAG: hypothetical protein ACN6RK_03530 [Stenotrophomonas sp.]
MINVRGVIPEMERKIAPESQTAASKSPLAADFPSQTLSSAEQIVGHMADHWPVRHTAELDTTGRFILPVPSAAALTPHPPAQARVSPIQGLRRSMQTVAKRETRYANA